MTAPPAARRARVLRRDAWATRARRALPLALLAGIVAIPVLLYLPLLSEPFERDEGAYATLARGLLDGQLPYRDLFDHKPPLIYGWYALSFLLFGENIEAPRLLASLVLSATALLVFVEGRLLGSRPAGLVAAALFAGSTGLALLQPNANTEVFMLPPLTASLVCVTVALQRPATGRATLAWCLAAGALGGLAVMTKPVAAWSLLALTALVAIWALRAARPSPRSLLPPAAIVVGAGLVAAAVAVPWAILGALDDFVYENLHYNVLYGAQTAFSEKLRLMIAGGASFVFIAAPQLVVAALGLHSLRGRGHWPFAHVLVLWAISSVLAVASPGRFFLHYFVHLLPALALLSVPLVERARLEPRLRNVRPQLLAASATPLLAAVVLALSASIAVYLEPNAAARHEAKFPEVQAHEETQGPAIGAYLAARTTPDKRIYNFGRDSQLYFYAGRQPAARFFYDRPFWLDPPTLEETLASLSAAPPAYIVDTAQIEEPKPALGITAELDGRYYPPAFAALLAERYRYEGRVQYAEVYRLIER